jgi:hypothetical protein
VRNELKSAGHLYGSCWIPDATTSIRNDGGECPRAGPIKNPASVVLTGLEGGAALSGLLKKKLVNAALFAVFQQFISGGAGKCLEIGY